MALFALRIRFVFEPLRTLTPLFATESSVRSVYLVSFLHFVPISRRPGADLGSPGSSLAVRSAYVNSSRLPDFRPRVKRQDASYPQFADKRRGPVGKMVSDGLSIVICTTNSKLLVGARRFLLAPVMPPCSPWPDENLTQRPLRSSVLSVLRLWRLGEHGEARFGCGHGAALWTLSRRCRK